MKKINNPVSLGTFCATDAKFLAGTLAIHLDIPANVVNFAVDSGPTDWWHVYVPTSKVKLAMAYVKGWRVGKVSATVEHNPGAAVLWPEYAAFFAGGAS